MTRVLFIATICVSLLAPAVSKAQDESNVGIPCRDQALSFFHQLQTALRHNQRDQVAHLIHFPLRADIAGKSKLIHNEKDLLALYDVIFTAPRKAAIIDTADSEVWYRDQGYSIPYGLVWFDSFMPAGKSFPDPNSPGFCSAGKFGVKTVNQAAEETR